MNIFKVLIYTSFLILLTNCSFERVFASTDKDHLNSDHGKSVHQSADKIEDNKNSYFYPEDYEFELNSELVQHSTHTSILKLAIESFNDDQNFLDGKFYFRENSSGEQWSIENIKKIGEGGFGDIYKVRILSDKCAYDYAVKRLKYEDDVFNETRILQKVNFHPNIISLYAVTWLNKSNSDSNEKEPYLWMELADGDVKEKEVTQENYEQLVEALNYLKEKKITHGDIKPANILYKGKTWKLADFGGSTDAVEGKVKAFQSTPSYLPPEWHNLKNRGSDTPQKPEFFLPNIPDINSYDPFKVDVYSLGMSIGFLMYAHEKRIGLKEAMSDSYLGKIPFEEAAQLREYLLSSGATKVIDGREVPRSVIKKAVFDSLEEGPKKRIDVEVLLENLKN